MIESNIVDLTSLRLDKSPVIYDIRIVHDSKGFSFYLKDVAIDPRSLRAVADDLRRAAELAEAEAKQIEAGNGSID